MKNKSANAVMTRVRAKYASRLTVKDYETLSGFSSMGEAAAYLAQNKNYSPYFTVSAGRRDITREEFEREVKSTFYGTAKKLCSSENEAGSHIYRYLALGMENDLLLEYIINLSLGTPEKMLLKTAPELPTGTKLSTARLFKIKDVSELGRYLRKTKYAPLAAVLPKANDEKYDISLIETVLSKIKYSIAFKEIESCYGSETAAALEESIKIRTELSDFLTVYRAKKYYGMAHSSIRPSLTGYRCMLNASQWDRIISAPTEQQAIEVLEESGYAAKIERFGIENLELFKEKAAAAADIRKIHFSTDPIIVLSSYLRLLQDECDNLVKIAEGITYKMPREEIMNNLVI